MNHNDDFDRTVDDALAEYRDAEPLAGVEERVLQRLRLQHRTQRNRWYRWSAVLAGASMIVIALWSGLQHRKPQTFQQPESLATQQAPPPSTQAAAAVQAAGKITRRVPAQHLVTSARVSADRPTATWPPRAGMSAMPAGTESVSGQQFPTPSPLTSQERALIALAHTHPDVLLSQQGADQELTITPIDIKPLPDTYADCAGDN